MIQVRRSSFSFILGGLVAVAGPVQAGKCTADAEFVHSYPSNDTKSKFKFKFRVSSDNCTEYSCTGYVHYRVHFDYESGISNSDTTLISYRIPKDQKSREITHEMYPASSDSKLKIRDVEIQEVTCSTP